MIAFASRAHAVKRSIGLIILAMLKKDVQADYVEWYGSSGVCRQEF